MEIIRKAIAFAAIAHRNQVRKANGAPYILHPYTVGMMLVKQGCDDEVVAAGLLHDTVEDTDTTIEDIRREFGERIAELVEAESEPDKSMPWEDRKKHTIEHLKNAPLDVRMIACADKLHNITTIVEEYVLQGEKAFSFFKTGRTGLEWYYRELVKSMCFQKDIPGNVTIFREFQEKVEGFFGKK